MGSKHITLVRGPVVFTNGSINNEAVPQLGLAYISGYLLAKGYKVTVIDSSAEGLGKISPLKEYPGYSYQGITHSDVISRIPKQTRIIGFTSMFSGEWPVLRDLIILTRESFPEALDRKSVVWERV